MIQPAFVNTEITEIISFKEDFQMKKQEKNGKRSAVVFGRFCSAIALCTIIVTLAATALPIIALSVRGISDRPAAGADEGSNIYSAERDGAVFRLHILANSDSTEDQRVKLAVRDAVIEYEREQTGAADAFDAADAESILRAHGDGILQTVRRTLKKCGAEYDAQLAVGKFDFPDLVMRTAELVFLAGYGVTVFDAILKDPDIRLVVFAEAGDDEIGIGDISDACRLGIFIPALLCDREYNFFHLWFIPPKFYFCLFGKRRRCIGR